MIENPADRTYLGIDVGGTKVALRLEGAGRPPAQDSFPWHPQATAAEDMAALARHVQEFLAGEREPLAAAGVAVPVTLDERQHVTAWPNRPSWRGLDLGARLRALLPGARLEIGDDGDLAALAEAAHAGSRDLVYLGVGTGVGGGLVLDGRPCPGPARGSSELGHMVVDRSGPLCDCGRRGCLQAFASGPATLRRAARLRGRAVEFAELRAAVEAGEPWARETVAATGEALALAVVSLGEALHTGTAVIGGGFAAAIPAVVEETARSVAALVRPGVRPPRVAAAGLGGLSSLHGALLLARQG
ncbi:MULTISPECIES: ROK family protein [unclassified Streptomyces]|uniref:ROK family protein n=1 Tax=unclassified Streptomyces TaxID=2593676 RepID=UPI0033F767DC